ncbi:hypothetical protein PVAP13_9KG405800 [Panicum virgatum]|uniref:Aldose 1-epimerase n=1 Tax=Panicum virgatum TaxID=38727 RepID=A0A8T0NNR4_PANVG|nr:hypothetical protein PVAP13_9KG405800 [Panicum virgatum]
MAGGKGALLLCVAIVLLAIGNGGAEARKQGKQSLGFYELRRGEFSMVVTNWGATILAVRIPDKNGHIGDVVLGYKDIGSYVNDTTYFGALVGRVANRIAGGRFTIRDRPYHTFRNDGNNTLHGGHRGFGQVFWSVRERVTGEFPHITFSYRSYDGEQGFPGALDVLVTYKIDGDCSYSVTMYARPLDKPTPVNLAQHTYWNLRGHGNGTVLGHAVQIFASAATSSRREPSRRSPGRPSTSGPPRRPARASRRWRAAATTSTSCWTARRTGRGCARWRW